MTKIQRMAVSHLFYLFGNSGPKYTGGNHHFLSAKLEGRGDALHYQPTEECTDAFEAVMAGDYSPLPEKAQGQIGAKQAEEAHWREMAGVEDDAVAE